MIEMIDVIKGQNFTLSILFDVMCHGMTVIPLHNRPLRSAPIIAAQVFVPSLTLTCQGWQQARRGDQGEILRKLDTFCRSVKCFIQ